MKSRLISSKTYKAWAVLTILKKTRRILLKVNYESLMKEENLEKVMYRILKHVLK